MPNFDNAYGRQLALLVDVLPHVANEPDFALKGGTAINLFFRDLPRLSVDIDLAWLPLSERDEALAGISSALGRIRDAIERAFDSNVRLRSSGDGTVTGLLVTRQHVPVKVDVTPVVRGSVYEPERRSLMPRAADRYGFVEIQTLGFADLYAGKLVAALDRQHPRDLFDVMLLLANEGITDALWSAFLVYLVASNRPIAELLEPNRTPLQSSFVEEFAGMTEDSVDASALERAREGLLANLHGRIDENVAAFLRSVERAEPEWDRLGLPAHVPDLPAIRWKLRNLAQRSPEKQASDYRTLEETLRRVTGEADNTAPGRRKQKTPLARGL